MSRKARIDAPGTLHDTNILERGIGKYSIIKDRQDYDNLIIQTNAIFKESFTTICGSHGDECFICQHVTNVPAFPPRLSL